MPDLLGGEGRKGVGALDYPRAPWDKPPLAGEDDRLLIRYQAASELRPKNVMGNRWMTALGVVVGFLVGFCAFLTLDNLGHYPFTGSDELGIGHELGPVLFGILGGIGGGVVGRLWKRQRESENRSP